MTDLSAGRALINGPSQCSAGGPRGAARRGEALVDGERRLLTTERQSVETREEWRGGAEERRGRGDWRGERRRRRCRVAPRDAVTRETRCSRARKHADILYQSVSVQRMYLQCSACTVSSCVLFLISNPLVLAVGGGGRTERREELTTQVPRKQRRLYTRNVT